MSKLRKEVQALIESNAILKNRVEAQALIIDDITTAQAATTTYKGNAYPTYADAIAEMARKYEGTAPWGLPLAGMIADVRAQFIIGDGPAFSPAKETKGYAAAELEFIDRFVRWNDIDRETAQEWAKEAEIEGCFLGQLFWDKKAKMVSVRFRSRAKDKYTIETDPRDYADYLRATWTENGAKQKIEAPDFVYGRFSGRVHQPNIPYPKIAKCLAQIEAVEKALRDWREINHLFAAPIPVVECANAADAAAMAAKIGDLQRNYRLRKLVVISGTLKYVTPDMSVVDALEKEIVTNAKIISGTTGVPVHFLGLPDLMSNRSTAENLMELVSASTNKERQVWKGLYAEMIEKAMAIYSRNSTNAPLDSGKVIVDIPYITQESWDRIASLYFPLWQDNAIQLKTLLSKIPGIDVSAEMKAAEERESKALEIAKHTDPDDEDDDESTDEGDDEK